jgi:hypothetical protein
MPKEWKRPVVSSAEKPTSAERIATLREQLENLRKQNAPQNIIDLVRGLLMEAEAAELKRMDC